PPPAPTPKFHSHDPANSSTCAHAAIFSQASRLEGSQSGLGEGANSRVRRARPTHGAVKDRKAKLGQGLERRERSANRETPQHGEASAEAPTGHAPRQRRGSIHSNTSGRIARTM